MQFLSLTKRNVFMLKTNSLMLFEEKICLFLKLRDDVKICIFLMSKQVIHIITITDYSEVFRGFSL
jgi:hypothetical protein